MLKKSTLVNGSKRLSSPVHLRYVGMSFRCLMTFKEGGKSFAVNASTSLIPDMIIEAEEGEGQNEMIEEPSTISYLKSGL